MNSKINFILGCIFLMIAGYSCSDDFLDRSPLDRISDNDVWGDVNFIESTVNDVYNILRHGHSEPFEMIGLTDEGFRRGGPNGYWDVQSGTVTPTNMACVNHWANLYSVITQCNYFFDKTKDTDFTADQMVKMNRMNGEMKFLRAYAYFRLVAWYGGVPLITKPFSLSDDFNLPKNTYSECMDFVVSELDGAAALLSVSYTGAEIGRLTRGAALALKARALLYMASPLNNATNDKNKWQAAADAAKAVIDLNVYSLFSDYRTLFLEENELNGEIIWDRRFRNKIRAEHAIDLLFWPNGSGGYGQQHPTQNLIDSYETTNGLLPKDDPSYNPQNPYANRDPRFYASIMYNGMPWKGRKIETFLPGGLDSREGPTGWNASETGYYPLKYCREEIEEPPARANTGNTQWIYIRYTEVLLNYAEAQFYLGNEDVCREYLNKVRDRESVQMPHITESGSALEERMRNERRIELVFEEHRFFDVRRWKIAEQTERAAILRMDVAKLSDGTIKYEVVQFRNRNFFEKNYVMPIPQDEINKSKLLEQNPGYIN